MRPTLTKLVLAASLALAAGAAPIAHATSHWDESGRSGFLTQAWSHLGFTDSGALSATTVGATSSNRPYVFISGNGNPSSGGTATAFSLHSRSDARGRIRAEVNGARELSPDGIPGVVLNYDLSTGACVMALLENQTGIVRLATRASSSSPIVVVQSGSVPSFDPEEDYKLDFTASGTTLTVRVLRDDLQVTQIQALDIAFGTGKSGFVVIARDGQTAPLRGTFRDLAFHRLNRGDWNDDSRSDLYWHYRGDDSLRGSLVTWRVGRRGDDRPQFEDWSLDSSSSSRIDPSEYQIIGSGDINNDGRDDLFVRRLSDNMIRVRFVSPSSSSFRMSDDSDNVGGSRYRQDDSRWASIAPAPLDWTPAGVGDFSGDGIADVVWRNQTTGQNGLWLLDAGGNVTWREIAAVGDTTWSISGCGDMDDDGSCDIIWQRSTDGLVGLWFMDDSDLREFRASGFAQGWNVVGVGNFDDSTPSGDIVWMNSTSGEVGCWGMNRSGSVSTWTSFASVDPSVWQGKN